MLSQQVLRLRAYPRRGGGGCAEPEGSARPPECAGPNDEHRMRRSFDRDLNAGGAALRGISGAAGNARRRLASSCLRWCYVYTILGDGSD